MCPDVRPQFLKVYICTQSALKLSSPNFARMPHVTIEEKVSFFPAEFSPRGILIQDIKHFFFKTLISKAGEKGDNLKKKGCQMWRQFFYLGKKNFNSSTCYWEKMVILHRVSMHEVHGRGISLSFLWVLQQFLAFYKLARAKPGTPASLIYKNEKFVCVSVCLCVMFS